MSNIVFSKVNLGSGQYQLEIREKNMQESAVITDKGTGSAEYVLRICLMQVFMYQMNRAFKGLFEWDL